MDNAFVLQSVLSELEARQRDLTTAAELGQSLLESNELLRIEHNDALDAFRQQIHELENERRMLELRLCTVESDYDSQIKELQNNIVSMRIDVQKQKSMFRRLEDDRLTVIADLTQKNQALSRRLQSGAKSEGRLKQEIQALRSQCSQRKASMQDHLHTLTSLRQEISQLRDEKSRLAAKLATVTEERDQLVHSLSDSRERMQDMHQVQQEQLATIQSQDNEIAHLEQRAGELQEHLHNLTVKQTNNNHNASASVHTESASTSRSGSRTASQPHQSLLAELAEQRLELWTHASFGLNDEDDDDEVEMDDDALLAYMTSMNSENQTTDAQPIPSTSDVPEDPPIESKDALLCQLRSEIGEIFQQMRLMCVEVQALGGSQANGHLVLNGGGTHTPDELALVEMDFRLNSLRSVLGDLRGLLRELVSESSLADIEQNEHQSHEEQSNGNIRPPMNGLVDSHDEQMDSNDPEAMLQERDALANEVASVKEQLSSLQQRLQSETLLVSNRTGPAQSIETTGTSGFVANWQEFDDDEYEFELPRETANLK